MKKRKYIYIFVNLYFIFVLSISLSCKKEAPIEANIGTVTSVTEEIEIKKIENIQLKNLLD